MSFYFCLTHFIVASDPIFLPRSFLRNVCVHSSWGSIEYKRKNKITFQMENKVVNIYISNTEIFILFFFFEMDKMYDCNPHWRKGSSHQLWIFISSSFDSLLFLLFCVLFWPLLPLYNSFLYDFCVSSLSFHSHFIFILYVDAKEIHL